MKKLVILLLPLVLIQCSTWYRLTKKESHYYTPAETAILRDTTTAIDFSYGFDPSLELDYVYRAGTFPDKELEGKSKNMLEALKKYDATSVVAFYEKMYGLQEIITCAMNNAEKDEEWEDYTLLQKYILPDMQKYVEMLEKNVILINQGYSKLIEERKGEIKKQVDDEFAD